MSKIESPGRHRVTVKTAEFGESETGKPFVKFSFENKDGDYIGGWLYLSEAAFKNSLKTLRDAFKFDGNFETLVAQVEGKECDITTEFEPYNGEDRLKVKWINAPTTAKPISDAGSFLKQMTELAKRTPVEAKRAVSTVKPVAKAAPKAVVVADEPF